MKKHTTKLTSISIERSGLPSDYKKVIAEYIWNGFDANASVIKINYDSNEVGFINSFQIIDNGTGIKFEELDETFGNFNVSKKMNSFSNTGFVKGKKGKGRFSFTSFCNKAIWKTTYESLDNNFLSYKLEINKEDSQNYSTDDKVISKVKETGTILTLSDFYSLTSDMLEENSFENYLANEFGWFLYLNKEQDYKIIINGSKLYYDDIIIDNEDDVITIGDFEFKTSYIQWNENIGDKYFYYFLNNEKKESARKHTSFNNKAIDFHHSVYIESDYFDDFKITKKDEPSVLEKNQTDVVFKTLVTILNEKILEKEKHFIRNSQAENLIEKFNKSKILPLFKSNDYEQLRKKDLENVIKDIYCIQPKIFQNLNSTQSKTLVGFLNLLLDTEQRDNILDILESVVNLSDEERETLAHTLKKTSLSNITSLIKYLENRYNVVAILKTLIYKLESFTNERDHIQSVIENNYWLFGEEFHLVSADKHFEIVLNNYLEHLENNSDKKPDIEKINKDFKLKRPDIFISRKIDIPDLDNIDHTVEENIIVELKRPSVTIGKKQFSQIEDYLGYIVNEDRFNSQLRNWKFYLVGKSVDDYIKGLYENQKNKGKKFLVQSIKNYEIFALTWDDLFKIFENRHKQLINRLEFKSSIIEELESKGITLSTDSSNDLTSKAVNQN
jgi:hypothetical protein